MLVEIAKDKKISLCGITPDQTVADFTPRDTDFGPFMKPADAILLSADLAVRGSLTECNVRGNNLNVELAKKLAKIATEKRVMLFGIKHDQTEVDFRNKGLGLPDAILIANDISVSGSLTQVR